MINTHIKIPEFNLYCKARTCEYDTIASFRFGSVYGNFGMDNVRCDGTEESLDNCTHSDSHDCTALEGAGVVCIGKFCTNQYMSHIYDLWWDRFYNYMLQLIACTNLPHPDCDPKTTMCRWGTAFDSCKSDWKNIRGCSTGNSIQLAGKMEDYCQEECGICNGGQHCFR